MARKLIVLALVFVAIVGLAAAAEPAPSTTDQPAAEAPLSDDFIGTDDGDAAGAPSADGSAVVPGPMGSSTTLAGGPSEKDGSATLKFSAIVGAAAVAIACVSCLCIPQTTSSSVDGNGHSEELHKLISPFGTHIHLNYSNTVKTGSLKLFFATLMKMVTGVIGLGRRWVLLALEDLVGLMEAGGGEKLHVLKENLCLYDIDKCSTLAYSFLWDSWMLYNLYAVNIMPVSSIV
ncbi:hypothetical protein SADUNF_Sadunf12G0073600 [Salix dunnii]|uniref:Uncharacterized protein n=1 Tax=Salix dunnii TaxID=1413687 RepID=A0A835JND5_9ROSI|nr:hypothetical protein SADUNF_Sadunf12G0073600 [Salix dunnii]